MTTTEVAQKLGISPARVWAMIITKKIKATKEGKNYKIAPSEVEGWIRQKHGTRTWLHKIK